MAIFLYLNRPISFRSLFKMLSNRAEVDSSTICLVKINLELYLLNPLLLS